MNLEACKAYEIKELRDIPDLNSKGALLMHKKSGAKVVVMENDDPNKVLHRFSHHPRQQHGSSPYHGAHGSLRIPQISCKRSFCGTGKRLLKHLLKRHDLSRQNRISRGKL